MVEACFNELSIQPYCTDDSEVDHRVSTFVDSLKGLWALGVRNVRYESSFADLSLKENLSLKEYCDNARSSRARNHKDLLYSVMHRPYIDDDKSDSVFGYDSVVFVTDSGEEISCLGLYVAYLTRSFAVGFDSGLFKGDRHNVCKLRLVTGSVCKEDSVCCLTQADHIETIREFETLVASQIDLPVPECLLPPEKKKIHLPAHHGYKECIEHSQRLVKEKYVTGVLNSIDFDSSEKEYIHRVEDKNIIELRLYWTPKGYGLCIQTSAESRIQNKWIARYLDKKYGKKK